MGDDLLRCAVGVGDAHPLEIQAGKDPVHIRGEIQWGEVDAPIIFIVAGPGEEEHVGVVVVGTKLLKALPGQAAEPDLDGFAVQDAFQVDVQPLQVLELLDIPIKGFHLGGIIAALLGQLARLAGKAVHISDQLLVLQFGGQIGGAQRALQPGDGGLQAGERIAVGIFLLHGCEAGGIGEKGHGIVRLKNAAVSTGLHHPVETGHMADDAHQLHFSNSHRDHLLNVRRVQAWA